MLPSKSRGNVRKKKPYTKATKRACQNCRAKHLRCNASTPCIQCLGFGHICHRAYRWVKVSKGGESPKMPIKTAKITKEPWFSITPGGFSDHAPNGVFINNTNANSELKDTRKSIEVEKQKSTDQPTDETIRIERKDTSWQISGQTRVPKPFSNEVDFGGTCYDRDSHDISRSSTPSTIPYITIPASDGTDLRDICRSPTESWISEIRLDLQVSEVAEYHPPPINFVLQPSRHQVRESGSHDDVLNSDDGRTVVQTFFPSPTLPAVSKDWYEERPPSCPDVMLYNNHNPLCF